MDDFQPKFGWLRDLPDPRDLTANSTKIPGRLQSAGQLSVRDMLGRVPTPAPGASPTSVDLRSSCSPIVNQGNLGSCTANAVSGLVEYFEKKSFGKYTSASRLFLYKTTRNLMFLTGDTGAYLRTTLAALTLFGAPPEIYYPYNISKFDDEPTGFAYSLASNFQALSYYRLDTVGLSSSALLTNIKANLVSGLPAVFGLPVFSSYTQASSNGGCFPYPTNSESVVGGHALMVVGYDDSKTIKNTLPNGIQTTGALMVRNSWGISWGSSGYGWLPYQYVTAGLTSDWWSLVRNEWIDTGQFGI